MQIRFDNSFAFWLAIQEFVRFLNEIASARVIWTQVNRKIHYTVNDNDTLQSCFKKATKKAKYRDNIFRS